MSYPFFWHDVSLFALSKVHEVNVAGSNRLDLGPQTGPKTYFAHKAPALAPRS